MMTSYTWTEYLASLPACKDRSWSGGKSWCGGETFTSALDKMRNGDDSYVARAETLLDQLENVTDGVPKQEWTPSPFGAYPVVPEYLAGVPVCMRRLSPSGLSPAKIVVSTTCSAGIDCETMTERGVAILALCMKLQAIRPIELYLCVEGNNQKAEVGTVGNLFQMIRIDTHPLSIAHACFALANVGFARALTYTHMHHYHEWRGDWPRDYHKSGYEAIVRRECEMMPEDLWIGSSYLHDELLMSDPVAWVNAQIKRFTPSEAS